MAIIRFPDRKGPKLEKAGTFKVSIVFCEIRKGKSDKFLLYLTFQTLKKGRQIVQCWPINQYENSLLHKNMVKLFDQDPLHSIDTKNLTGMKCMIEVSENDDGFLEVTIKSPFKEKKAA